MLKYGGLGFFLFPITTQSPTKQKKQTIVDKFFM